LPLTTPLLIENAKSSPPRDPITHTLAPERGGLVEISAQGSPLSPLTRTRAESASWSTRSTSPSSLRPSLRRTSSIPPSTTWAAVGMHPSGETTPPLATPSSVLVRTLRLYLVSELQTQTPNCLWHLDFF